VDSHSHLPSASGPLHVNLESSSCAGSTEGKKLISVRRTCMGNSPMALYTLCEVRRHCTTESAWLVAGDCVYDATDYMARHPGGVDAILRKAGGVVDCIEDLQFHSRSGRKVWEKYLIGHLVPCTDSRSGVNRPWWQLW